MCFHKVLATFFMSPQLESTTLSPPLLIRLLWISYQILLTSALTVFWTPDLYRIIKRLYHAEEAETWWTLKELNLTASHPTKLWQRIYSPPLGTGSKNW